MPPTPQDLFHRLPGHLSVGMRTQEPSRVSFVRRNLPSIIQASSSKAISHPQLPIGQFGWVTSARKRLPTQYSTLESTCSFETCQFGFVVAVQSTKLCTKRGNGCPSHADQGDTYRIPHWDQAKKYRVSHCCRCCSPSLLGPLPNSTTVVRGTHTHITTLIACHAATCELQYPRLRRAFRRVKDWTAPQPQVCTSSRHSYRGVCHKPAEIIWKYICRDLPIEKPKFHLQSWLIDLRARILYLGIEHSQSESEGGFCTTN